jgi:NADPH-dependent curcumin reductase
MTNQLKQIVLSSRPTGRPTPENFTLRTGPMPTPGAGEFLARTIWLSLDPYMRGRMSETKSYADPVKIGEAMEGACVAQVMQSRSPEFKEGDYVLAPLGWVSHGVSDGTGVMKLDPNIAPLSTALGVLGMPGMTAWTGLNLIGGAKAGETILVSAATGAVGSLAGQLARAKGLRVLGVAGGPDKCNYAVEELGYEHCFDHRAYCDVTEMAKAIAAKAPDGIDIYFENVGGITLQSALPLMRQHGRIPVCGLIAWYSGEGMEKVTPLPAAMFTILSRRLKVEGFIVSDHYDHMGEFLTEVAPRVVDGTIKYRETVSEGLETAPDAFLRMLDGGNFGKQLVRVSDA